MSRTRAGHGLHITGATGYLGAELLRQAPGATDERVEIRDAAAVRVLFGRFRPRVVIHTTYSQDGEGAWETIVDGAENVACAANGVGARLLHLSTDVVFDGRKGSPYVEGDALCPVTEYGRVKAAGRGRAAGTGRASECSRRADLAELIAGRPVHRAPTPEGRPRDCSLDSSRARMLLRAELRGVRTVLA